MENLGTKTARFKDKRSPSKSADKKDRWRLSDCSTIEIFRSALSRDDIHMPIVDLRDRGG